MMAAVLSDRETVAGLAMKFIDGLLLDTEEFPLVNELLDGRPLLRGSEVICDDVQVSTAYWMREFSSGY
jgi:hypothetical protein